MLVWCSPDIHDLMALLLTWFTHHDALTWDPWRRNHLSCRYRLVASFGRTILAWDSMRESKPHDGWHRPTFHMIERWFQRPRRQLDRHSPPFACQTTCPEGEKHHSLGAWRHIWGAYGGWWWIRAWHMEFWGKEALDYFHMAFGGPTFHPSSND